MFRLFNIDLMVRFKKLRKTRKLKKSRLIYYYFEKTEINKLLFKLFINKKNKYKYFFYKKLSLLKNNRYSLSYLYKICLFTGRTRSIYNLFRISRINLKLESSFGLFLGLKKAS